MFLSAANYGSFNKMETINYNSVQQMFVKGKQEKDFLLREYSGI